MTHFRFTPVAAAFLRGQQIDRLHDRRQPNALRIDFSCRANRTITGNRSAPCSFSPS